MSTIGRNARVQTFAKVVDSFVDYCVCGKKQCNKHSYNVTKHA